MQWANRDRWFRYSLNPKLSSPSHAQHTPELPFEFSFLSTQKTLTPVKSKMGFVAFLRSFAKKALDAMTKELFKELWKSVVLPVLVTVVLPRISNLRRFRSSFFNVLGQIHPGADYEPSPTEYYLYYSGTFFVFLRAVLVGWWCWKLITRARKRWGFFASVFSFLDLPG